MTSNPYATDTPCQVPSQQTMILFLTGVLYWTAGGDGEGWETSGVDMLAWRGYGNGLGGCLSVRAGFISVEKQRANVAKMMDGN